ncbi:hypothetical protein CRG98_043967 [Punica granatum]|uniref:Uncharacterized protein n=1 Tax=Punica granatum TaxID=22663 RepID=A0A2I0HVU4_PUNGR|nr:hypothetical protein CRG98_043967 [Punica granatum]
MGSGDSSSHVSFTRLPGRYTLPSHAIGVQACGPRRDEIRFDQGEEKSVGLCAHPNFVSSGHAGASLCNAAWECPPSRGRAMDARVKESPLPVYDPKVESW